MRAVLSPLLLLTLAFAGNSAPAQTASPDAPKVVRKNTPMASYVADAACPIQFSAQRYGLTATMRQTEHGQVGDFTQSLRLRFNPVDSVQSIEVVVHGRAARVEMLPLSSEAAETATQTFRLTRAEGSFKATQFVATSSVPLVTRLELTRVEYTDGSIWREAAPGACSIQPSPLVLVNAEVH